MLNTVQSIFDQFISWLTKFEQTNNKNKAGVVQQGRFDRKPELKIRGSDSAFMYGEPFEQFLKR